MLTFTLTQFHVCQSRAPYSRTVTHNIFIYLNIYLFIYLFNMKLVQEYTR